MDALVGGKPFVPQFLPCAGPLMSTRPSTPLNLGSPHRQMRRVGGSQALDSFRGGISDPN